MPSPALVDAIDQLDPVRYEGDAYRHVALPWHPLSGAGARSQGGRWNPPESFATLYLALDQPTAAAEFRRLAHRAGRQPEDLLPRNLHRIHLDLHSVLDLAGARQLPGALADLDFLADDLVATQAVGEAAQYLGREAIRAPSATGSGEVIAVFIDCLKPDSLVEPKSSKTWTTPP